MASQVTINLTTMAGNSCQLSPLPWDSLVRELAHEIRENLSIPIATQNLLPNGGELITDPLLKLVEIFGEVEVADVMVVRRQLTQAEKSELHINLVRASAGGDIAEVTELLKEGAEVELSAPEVETEAELAKEEPEEASYDEASDSDASDPSPIYRKKPVTRAMIDPSGACGGLTPLMMATAMQNHTLASMLREKGAKEPDMQPQTNSLPEAFGKEDFVEVVRHIAGGADLNTSLSRGQGVQATSRGTPLHACCAMHRQAGAYETAQLLLKMKADTSLGDSEGDTPLAHAKYFHADEIYNLLESNGAVVGGPFYRMFGRR